MPMTEAEFESALATGNQEELVSVIERIIKEYAVVLGAEGALLRDVRDLPSPKSVIAIALLTAIKVLPPGIERDNLRTIFAFLSNFQPMTAEEKAAITRHWGAVINISELGPGSPDAVRAQAETISETGDVVSRFQAMANAEAETLKQQLQVAD
jgi:hypothetical protein